MEQATTPTVNINVVGDYTLTLKGADIGDIQQAIFNWLPKVKADPLLDKIFQQLASQTTPAAPPSGPAAPPAPPGA